MLEKLRELETAQNYSEMLSTLKEYASTLTQGYSQVGSIMTNPTIEGVLRSLEEMSVTATSLLRYCETLLEGDVTVTTLPTQEDVPSSSLVSSEAPREREVIRDDTFTINTLNDLISEFPRKEISETGANISAKFWYIKGGQNESVEITRSEEEIFGKIIIEVLQQLEADTNEKFSISPLGFEALLKHQFQSSFDHITKSYGNEFTIIKLYN
ncbi:MAG: hypothetical protein ACFE9L_02115 [Candidatus Hodarchaeota archaeon]